MMRRLALVVAYLWGAVVMIILASSRKTREATKRKGHL